jgi:alkanesulfonate monooxygenase SsuD/methylene tetrahydromethanopterin reductase-like flavin-dependent oxidoreductase (luciferase family)
MTRVGAVIKRDVPPERVAALAADAAPGLDELWIIEDLNWAGGISQLAAVLDATDNDAAGRPLVAHGIAPAPFRNPAALAMEWATVARMHPGRVIGGIGHGVPGWMRRLGEQVDSPLTLLRETIESTIQMLAGERVTYDGRYVSIRDVELVYPPTSPVPVVAGVTGPNSLRLSGEVADGTVIAEGFGPGRLRQARSLIDEGRAGAGRTEPHHMSVFTGFYCGDLERLPPAPPDVPDGFAAVAPDPAAVAAVLQTIIDAGADSLVILPFGPDLEQIRLFVEEVTPLLDL